MKNSTLPYKTKHPAFLPAKSHLTSPIIRECHEKVKHRGVKDTLEELDKQGKASSKDSVSKLYCLLNDTGKDIQFPRNP